jgi:hypothetical protein
MLVELLDEEEEGALGKQGHVEEIVAGLEAMEDEAEEIEDEQQNATADDELDSDHDEDHHDADDYGPPATLESRLAHCVPPMRMRLLLATSEECHLYELAPDCSTAASSSSSTTHGGGGGGQFADARLATFVFEHDLVSLSVRGTCMLLALTTAGLEVHALWSGAHPLVAPYLTLPLVLLREEPVLARSSTVSLATKPERKLQDMLVLDCWIVLRPSPSSVASSASPSPSSTMTPAGASAANLIVRTADTDACEGWPSLPFKALPSVAELVRAAVQPLQAQAQAAAASSSSSGHQQQSVSSQAVRLYAEGIVMLVQRYTQLRTLQRSAKRHHQRVVAAAATHHGESASKSFSMRRAAASLCSMQSELAEVCSTLSSLHASLGSLFRAAPGGEGLALAGFFLHYQAEPELPLQRVWSSLSQALRACSSSNSGSGSRQAMLSASVGHDSHVAAHAKALSKFILRTLSAPTASERAALRNSPDLVASFVAHLGSHAPHILPSLLLKSFLLHCPINPRSVLKILEEQAARGNFENSIGSNASSAGDSGAGSSANSTPGPSRGHSLSHSRSSSPTGNSSNTHGGSASSYRVRPVVFHTFVQALLHLQIQSMGADAPTVTSTGAVAQPNGRDCASILLNSFSAHSLEVLLLSHPVLLTRWSHRSALLDFLRVSTPWSLLEVLVGLTQRGVIDGRQGVTMLLGAQQAAAVLSSHAAGVAALAATAATSPLASQTTVDPATLPPLCFASGAVSPSSSASSGSSGLSSQLCSYLECSLDPFMLRQELGVLMEEGEHRGEPVMPWDDGSAVLDGETATSVAIPPTAVAAAAGVDDSVRHADDPFVPLHARQNHKHSSHQVAMREDAAVSAGRGTRAGGRRGATKPLSSMTRGQVASLAEQLACVYIQQEIAATAAELSSSSASPPAHRTLASPLASVLRRAPSISPGPGNSSSNGGGALQDFAARHALGTWWRSNWIDSVLAMTASGAVSPNHNKRAASASAISSRVKKLQAILCGPLPMERSNFERIFTLLRQWPVSSSRSAVAAADGASSHVDPVRLSLLLLVLPRVGQLSSALRLIVAHAPESVWPYALIYCSRVPHVLRPPPSSSSLHALLPWQILHAVLLLHVYYSAHSRAVLTTHTGLPLLAMGERKEDEKNAGAVAPFSSAKPVPDDDEMRARQLLSGLLSADVIEELLRPLDGVLVGTVASSNGAPSPSASRNSPLAATAVPAAAAAAAAAAGMSFYTQCQSSLPPSERASLFLQLYTFVLEQFLARHPPREFLAFIPAAGSANFFLPLVQRNLRLHPAAQRHPQQPPPHRGQPPAAAAFVQPIIGRELIVEPI